MNYLLLHACCTPQSSCLYWPVLVVCNNYGVHAARDNSWVQRVCISFSSGTGIWTSIWGPTAHHDRSYDHDELD